MSRSFHPTAPNRPIEVFIDHPTGWRLLVISRHHARCSDAARCFAARFPDRKFRAHFA